MISPASEYPKKLAWALAAVDLLNPALLLVLLLPVFFGRASVGNAPAIAARGVVSGVFLLAALALLVGKRRFGWVASLLAATLNVAVVIWFWAGSGVNFTQEILAWLVVLAAVVALSIAMRRRQVDSARRASGRPTSA